MARTRNDGADGAYAAEVPACWRGGQDAADAKGMGAWEAYWEGLKDNQRLFREQANEFLQNLEARIGLHQRLRVLDFGSGFGHVADMLAPRVGELFLWDASANMRQCARARVGNHGNVRFLDLSDSPSSHPALQLDMILVNSVIQYMDAEEFSDWFLCWRKMLAPGGRLVISDIIPPEYPAYADIMDLLKFSSRRGFVLRAICQATTEIWRYWGVRRVRPLTRISRQDLDRQAQAAGLMVSYPWNLTHFTMRMTAVFTRVGADQ